MHIFCCNILLVPSSFPTFFSKKKGVGIFCKFCKADVLFLHLSFPVECRFVGCQTAFSGQFVFYDRKGVSGGVQVFNPIFDIGEVVVKFLDLLVGVENPEVRRGIGPAAGNPLPAGCVIGQICIHQRIPEPGLSQMPMQAQILHQKGADNHPHPVMHIASAVKLAHAGIDNRIAGLAAGPGLQGGAVLAPVKRIKARLQGARRQLRKLGQQMIGKFPPAQL